jgi:hypothetical protein
MTKNEKLLCGLYAAIALISLIATWAHNLAFFAQPENRELTSFIRALYVNHASASIANDIFLFGLAAFIFMVQEAKKLAIRHVWLYILLSCLIAISVIFPLFLIARQAAIAKQRQKAQQMIR